MSAPIADLAALLMSHGLSSDVVRLSLELAEAHAAKAIADRTIVGGSSADVVRSSADRRKEYDRNRQAEIRRLRRAEKTGDILTSLSSSLLSEETLKKERKKESSGIRARNASAVPDDWPADFGDLFWQAYPRKEEKIAAMKKLAILRKSGIVTFADLMAGVDRYCSVKREPQFIKQPTVWLNKGCWADETQTGAISGERSGNTRPSGHDAIFAAFARKAGEIPRDCPMARAAGEDEFPVRDGSDHRTTEGTSGASADPHKANNGRESFGLGVFEGEIIPPDKPPVGVSGRRQQH